MLKLNVSYTENEVFNEFLDYGIEGLKFIKVSRFTTKSSRLNKRTLPIFIIQLSADSNLTKLKGIKYISHDVYWEKRKKNEIIQCKRCQRLGHAAVNCNMQYRCVKCNKEHKPGDCKNLRSDINKVYCINCNNFGHPASYRGYPKINEIKARIDNRNKIKNNNLLIPNNDISSNVTPDSSYADVARKEKLPNQMHNNSNPKWIFSNNDQNHFNRLDVRAFESSAVSIKTSASCTQVWSKIDFLGKAIENIFSRLDIVSKQLEEFLTIRQ